MKLTLVPAGAFLMGSPPEEKFRSADEGPQHRVHIKEPFYLGVYPVTRREFAVVMGPDPRSRGGPEHPAAGVSWDEAMAFCARLSRLPAERRAGRAYALPSEAQWEYACRAGSTGAFVFGPSLSSRQANFNGLYPGGGAPDGPFVGRTTRVGSYPANAWGLCDMHGNVWEWCDGYYYDEEHYRTCPRSAADEGQGGRSADPRVVRGGCWASKGWRCRCAERFATTAATGTATIGFRVAYQPG
jgi:formylglycine-generating enzyme required for sulfatase activity